MSKAKLIGELAGAIGISKRESSALLTSLTEIAYRETRDRGEFTIPGIGKLIKRERKARMGRNPQTGEALEIPARSVVTLRLAKAAIDSLLGSSADAEVDAVVGETGIRRSFPREALIEDFGLAGEPLAGDIGGTEDSDFAADSAPGLPGKPGGPDDN